jgi:uncharacterized protein YndB with AHSA1/START domain
MPDAKSPDANSPAAAGSEFVLKRVLAAPRALVWKVWTEPEHLLQWFSPAGMTMANCTMDLRPGGSFLYCLRLPDGSDMWAKWVFREVAAPERLVWVHGFSDPAGNRNHHPMAPTWPLEMLCTLSFEERGGQTELTLRKTAYNANATEQNTFDTSHASMEMGWGGTLLQLVAHLARQQG